MSKIRELERAVRELTPEDLLAFRDWFTDFDARLWDQQIETDVAQGRLDSMSDEALTDLREGHCTDL